MITYHSDEPALEQAMDELFASNASTPEDQRRLRALIESAGPRRELHQLEPGRNYDVRLISAPVFGPSGEVALVVRLQIMAKHVPADQLIALRDQLLTSAANVTTCTRRRLALHCAVKPRLPSSDGLCRIA